VRTALLFLALAVASPAHAGCYENATYHQEQENPCPVCLGWGVLAGAMRGTSEHSPAPGSVFVPAVLCYEKCGACCGTGRENGCEEQEARQGGEVEK
jgi:hypothetical protein